MTDIRALLDTMAWEEASFRATTFLAPCVRGGRVRARIAGIVQTLRPDPREFEGWGVFRSSADGAVAHLVEEADLPLIERYMGLFPPLRLLLVAPLAGRTWLAYPLSESDMRQRFGRSSPVRLHLVTEGAVFETVTARPAGGWWFDAVDRRADPAAADQLRDAQRKRVLPDVLAFPGITPEMRAAYALAAIRDPAFAELRRQEQERRRAEVDQRLRRAERLREGELYAPLRTLPQGRAGRRDDTRRVQQALQTAGGDLHGLVDRGDYFVVDWESGNGERHVSAIMRDDLTVVSSGICLSGEDRKFDLQSLVAVMDQRPDWSNL